MPANDASFNDGSGLPSGTIIKSATTVSTSVATGTTLVPVDNTIPQITEGTEFMTVSITPRFSTSKLVIMVSAMVAVNTGADNIVGALFQDATANALAAGAVRGDAVDSPYMLVLNHQMTAGTTSATTFRFRAGPQTAGRTLTFNGVGGASLFGAITKSFMQVFEYTV